MQTNIENQNVQDSVVQCGLEDVAAVDVKADVETNAEIGVVAEIELPEDQTNNSVSLNTESIEQSGLIPPALDDSGAIALQNNIQLPNVTLPCVEGVVVDLKNFVPRNVDIDMVETDYVFGQKAKLADGKLKIFPFEPGEQEIGLAYLLNGKRCTTVLKLLVNQNPKKLWVRHDPPGDSPFMKDLYAKTSYEDANVRFMAASRRGRSHEQAGTFRDDDFGFWVSPNAGVYLIALADGAGSAKYSREGSRQAIQAVIDYLSPRLVADVWESDDKEESKEGKVAQMLVSAANNALVQLDAFCKAENQKTNASEKYALKDFNTTLLVAAVKVLANGARKIVTFSIGDGAIAWIEPGKSELLCAPDGGEYSGQTRFLTTTPVWVKASEDWSAFRAERIFVKMVASEAAHQGFIALMTDGVSDPFFETDVKLHDASIWDSFVLKPADVDEGERVIKNIVLHENLNEAAEKLLSWLAFWSRGNHDDRTIALLTPIKLTGIFGKPPFMEKETLSDALVVKDPEGGQDSESNSVWERCKHLLG